MNKTLKGVGAALSLVAGMGSASAFDTGGQALGSGVNVMDIFTINCPAGTAFLRADVQDLTVINNPAATVMGAIVKNGRSSVSVTSEGKFGPVASLPQGPGTYQMLFYKTATGTDDYRGILDCFNAQGNILPPIGAVTRTQNQ